MPKLLCYAEPGILIPQAMVEWREANLPHLKAVNVGAGTHYIQEDHPQEIGRAISQWMQEEGL